MVVLLVASLSVSVSHGFQPDFFFSAQNGGFWSASKDGESTVVITGLLTRSRFCFKLDGKVWKSCKRKVGAFT